MDIKNDAQLKKFLMGKCKEAVANVEKQVHEEFESNLNKFYSEFEPEYYVRTGALENSLVSTGAIQIGDDVVSEVGFDMPIYEKGLIELQNGEIGFAYWSDQKIFDTIMKGNFPHGGYEKGTPIWNSSMKSLGGKKGIERLIKQELKKQGL